MLSANELRIGNFVNVKTIWQDQIYSVSEGCVTLRANGLFPLEVIKPIPLTEEWLLKFDFDKYNLGFWCSSDALYFEYGDGRSVEIKYVHSLQNIYFALTGEELTIKNEN